MTQHAFDKIAAGLRDATNLAQSEKGMNMATALLEREEVTHVGLDKVVRYGWTMRNSPGELKHIDKTKLHIGSEYQREANQPKVLQISSDWDWIACGVIVVAKVSGKFRVIDGQHRVLGARKRSDIKELPCIVFETEGLAQEARGFLALNTLVKPVSAIDKHRARLVAEDPVAAKIQETLDRLGVIITKSASGPGQFGAISWAYRKALENPENFERVMTFTADLTREAGMPVAEKLVDGLWYINANVADGLDNKRLNQRLRHVGAVKLLDGAIRAAAAFARGGARVFAQGMLEVVNKGTHSRFEFKQG